MLTGILSRYGLVSVPCIIALLTLLPIDVHACWGKDVMLSNDPALKSAGEEGSEVLDEGKKMMHVSEARILPDQAMTIAENFLIKAIPEPPLPLTFRKLEWVHGRLIYQFQTQPIAGYNGTYHLGPVNFRVERAVLDVDAMTGDLSLANGCGAAPGQLLYKHNSDVELQKKASIPPGIFIPNNTKFIARNTGNIIKIDGKIEADEWRDTGHRYFYLGTYSQHSPSEPHNEPYYYAEVWMQTDERNIYFAVKTDSPYWVALMLKGDPNLGMLGAYPDAKLMKSDGEVTDRFFTQRKDSSFYLDKDKKDNILRSASRQEDFYTYEFAFPLDSGDPDDVLFEQGKAYNMLLLAGNTLDHYGIFTLDEAHADHDHSKSNKEHVNVWASNETTFRIGSPPEKDIYGRPVKPVFANYDSGFDPSKDDNHFHYAALSMKDFKNRSAVARYIGFGFLALSPFGAGIIIYRLRPSGRKRREETDGPLKD